MRRLLATLFLLVSSTLLAQEPSAARHFDYDHKAPLDVREAGFEERDGVSIHDISYLGANGARVPAYLVVPKGKGPFAAVIWGHWYWPSSPMMNRTEFLEEAVVLARAGAVSLLTDGPVARPGYVADRTPMSPKQFTDLVQQVVDMRRGADLLLARPDVDPKRLAFVGHSYNANIGGILAGVDKRFKAFVLMAGGLSDEVDMRSEEFKQYRQSVGPEKWDAFVAAHTWADAGRYISHAAPAFVFLQYGSREDYLTPDRARQYAANVSEPKRLEIYDAPHALSSAARRDRIAFLSEQLKLAPLTAEAIAKIPDLEQPAVPDR
ncbi:MAG TPA: hypothetical protein VEZ11_10310 [Thermoanaerobaculia bacterium]|nr:hypothetical protein [Thermoanaerobaculia bacterium]